MTIESNLSGKTICGSNRVCCLCKSGFSIEVVDNYKHMVDSDSQALGEMEIVI